MRFIRDIFHEAQAARRPMISFEFFPTKTPEGERTLLEKTIPALGELKPDFCSVTYGAGGSTRQKTLTIVDRFKSLNILDRMLAYDGFPIETVEGSIFRDQWIRELSLMCCCHA